MSKSLPAIWRDAIRDSALDRTAKLVAFVLATFMNRQGHCYPSQDTIAAGGSLTDRAVHLATSRLERSGFLTVERSKGRSSHSYLAALPATANPLRRSEWSTANGTHSNSERHAPNSERRSPESAESAKALRASGAPLDAAPLACPECDVEGGHHAADCSTVAA
jgi:hypothetical protein